MKPVASPLRIQDFAITEMEFKFLPAKNLHEDLSDYMDEYEIELDFGITSGNYLQVYIRAEINKGPKPLPGYQMMAEASCIFQFDSQAGLSEEIKNNLEGYSSIYIALNVLRVFISTITANAPMGRYILPSVDLNDLIKKKRESLAKTKDSGQTKKTSKKTVKPKRS